MFRNISEVYNFLSKVNILPSMNPQFIRGKNALRNNHTRGLKLIQWTSYSKGPK